MDQEDQFHSFWGEPTQMLDPGLPFFIPEIPKLPFEEQVPSPNAHEFSEGFQLSPTLIPMSSAPISTVAFPSFNTNEPDMLDKSSETLYSLRKYTPAQPSIEENISQMNDFNIYSNYSQPEPTIKTKVKTPRSQKTKHSKKTKLNSSLTADQIPNIQISSNTISSSQTQEFFENLSKVLDKPLTKEQIAFISNILPRGENQNVINVSPNNHNNTNNTNNTNCITNNISNITQKKITNSFNQRVRDINNRPNVRLNDDTDFNLSCQESEFVINPQKLGFIPSNSWMDKEITFGYLVTSFFQKRNNASSRFSHKLYNALRLSSAHPNLTPYIGVEWITPTILKVNKYTFARLLRIKTIDGSLFHQQGNFPSHGFVELTEREAHEFLTPNQLEDVDYETVRLLRHPAGIFTRDCTGSDIADCKWINSRRRLQ
ncbi:hypothetical protein M9Y10_006014 [Tritrichomonas musculus]|uniref:Initiator binding domain-containing protein n=1 Tax=Tritrichomonas musculus TaxID=1915356 RepID=A0ABR2JD40_9EUKA